ncbi:MAG: HAMP domain-containing protein [Deltaproteobacteria bacterium]|nr:HAMP domain-containing protein [Deltaproteobacteria bacterium]
MNRPFSHIPIRYKVLSVLAFLLLVAVCFYTLLASFLFRQEKVALLYEINHSIAINTASQLKSSIISTAEKIKFPVVLEMLSRTGNVRTTGLKDPSLQKLQLFRKTNDAFEPVPIEGQGEPKRKVIPGNKHLNEAVNAGIAFWGEPHDDQISFLLASRVDIKTDKKQDTLVAVLELESNFFFETMQLASVYKTYLVKKSGESLLECNRGKLRPAKALDNHPLTTLIKGDASGTNSGVLSFNFDGESWYGAYAPVGLADLYVFSQANRSEVRNAIVVLIQRSLLFALIVITLTFGVSILFTARLTKNIHILTESARQIGEGKLEFEAKIRSRDEIEELATTLGWMVTELTKSRDALDKYNRELEQKVAERTIELRQKNEAIKKAQEDLVKATQMAAVGEMAGRTAHEVLNPLTAIITRSESSLDRIKSAKASRAGEQIAELLKAWESDLQTGGMDGLINNWKNPSAVQTGLTLLEEDLGNFRTLLTHLAQEEGKVADDLQFVYEHSHKIQRIVSQMRELSRSSTVRETVRCYNLLKDALGTMAHAISKEKVKVVGHLKAAHDVAVLNRDEFTQIITNLIRNSIQAMAQNPAPPENILTIETSNEKQCLYVDIIDNGPGISAENQSKIFEQGFTTKPPSEGTGLGLAICRRYARAFGGEVELLFSKPDARQTCFRVTIPLKTEPTIAQAA